METTIGAPARRTGIRSWMLALVLGAMLAIGGAATVFASSPTADPSASPSTTQDAGGATEGSTESEGADGRNCPEKSGADASEDASST